MTMTFKQAAQLARETAALVGRPVSPVRIKGTDEWTVNDPAAFLHFKSPVTVATQTEPGVWSEECPRCGGSGVYTWSKSAGGRAVVAEGICFRCQGSGKREVRKNHQPDLMTVHVEEVQLDLDSLASEDTPDGANYLEALSEYNDLVFTDETSRDFSEAY